MVVGLFIKIYLRRNKFSYNIKSHSRHNIWMLTIRTKNINLC